MYLSCLKLDSRSALRKIGRRSAGDGALLRANGHHSSRVIDGDIEVKSCEREVAGGGGGRIGGLGRIGRDMVEEVRVQGSQISATNSENMSSVSSKIQFCEVRQIHMLKCYIIFAGQYSRFTSLFRSWMSESGLDDVVKGCSTLGLHHLMGGKGHGRSI